MTELALCGLGVGVVEELTCTGAELGRPRGVGAHSDAVTTLR